MNPELASITNEWKTFRAMTLELLETIPQEHIDQTVLENMGTLGKQFQHLIDVQICYNEAIESGVIDFQKKRNEYTIEKDKEKLLEFLKETDDTTLQLVEKFPEAQVAWDGQKVSLTTHIKYLIQHEILHHGELIVYMHALDLAFPKSWNALWSV